MFPLDIHQLRCIPCHVLGVATVKIPHLILGYYTDLQNSLGFKSWYPIKLGSSNISDAFKYLPNQTFRHIKLPYFIVSNGVVSLHTIKVSDER